MIYLIVVHSVLWSGTPMVTWPRYKHKMCSRVGASMARATGFGEKMIVQSLQEYEERAVELAQSYTFVVVQTAPGIYERRAVGELVELRRRLFLNRDHMPLFDTERWTRNLESGYREAWKRWALGTEFEASKEWEESSGSEKQSGCIWVEDTRSIEFRVFPDRIITIHPH
jgi:protein O-GlcNAc transferase